ncbi:MAG: hypothetical protein ACRDSK_14965 [Actinophytocola sp.]|uniref:hypothetical protein n=1 Tax=Actinophytocola sp. TaxID=1872138 RepID=UPI003D6B0D5E
MDWQDELRRLDKKLSEGEISAQDYRRMRDELLAEASAPAQGRGVMWAGSRPEVTEPATASPPPAGPPAVPADAEETQIVADTTVTLDQTVVHGRPAAPAEDPDKTETVAAETVAAETVSAENRPTEVVPAETVAAESAAAETVVEIAPGEEERTVSEPAAEPLTEPAREPETEPARDDHPTFPPRPMDTPPPDAPPLPAPAPWTGHQVIGEEVFADASPHSNARRAVTSLLAVLVVLALAGGAVWYFVFRTEEAPAAAQKPQNPPASDQPQSQPQSPPPTQEPTSSQPQSAPSELPTNLGDVVGPLPGITDENSGTITAEVAGRLKLISPQEVRAAQDHGVTQVIFRGSTKGDVGNALLVFTTPNGANAAAFTDTERGILRDAGFAPGKELQSGLPVLQRNDGGATVYRVVYSTGKYTVRFGVAQRDANAAQLRKELEAVADTILAVLPPS